MQGALRDLCHGLWGVSPVDGKFCSRYADRHYNDGVNGKPCAGFGVDFYGGESMQMIEKILARQQLVCDRGAGESLQVAVTPAGRAV